MKRRLSQDNGSVTLMTICVLVVSAATMGVLADAGSLFLQRRALASAADSAALAGAQAIDVSAVYRDGSDAPLRLKRSDAIRAVNRHVSEANYRGAIAGFRVASVGVTGEKVSVSVTASGRMWLGNLLGMRSVPLAATSSARPVVTAG